MNPDSRHEASGPRGVCSARGVHRQRSRGRLSGRAARRWGRGRWHERADDPRPRVPGDRPALPRDLRDDRRRRPLGLDRQQHRDHDRQRYVRDAPADRRHHVDGQRDRVRHRPVDHAAERERADPGDQSGAVRHDGAADRHHHHPRVWLHPRERHHAAASPSRTSPRSRRRRRHSARSSTGPHRRGSR